MNTIDKFSQFLQYLIELLCGESVVVEVVFHLNAIEPFHLYLVMLKLHLVQLWYLHAFLVQFLYYLGLLKNSYLCCTDFTRDSFSFLSNYGWRYNFGKRCFITFIFPVSYVYLYTVAYAPWPIIYILCDELDARNNGFDWLLL